jgi:hypothetical protein
MNTIQTARLRIGSWMVGSAITCAVVGTVSAQTSSISVPNGSFESPGLSPGGVSVDIGSWDKGITDPQDYRWTGVFYAVPDGPGNAGQFFPNGTQANSLDNVHGLQAGFVLDIPGRGFQQVLALPDGVFQNGYSYTLTVGVTSTAAVPATEAFSISLFHLNEFLQPVSVAETLISGGIQSPHLVDYTATVPTVQAGDSWVGQRLGIRLQVSGGPSSGGYWEIDNVRLTATSIVPEPSSWALAIVGVGGLLWSSRLSKARR